MTKNNLKVVKSTKEKELENKEKIKRWTQLLAKSQIPLEKAR